MNDTPDPSASAAPPSLRVTAVRAKEVLGARDFKLQPGKITVLRGWNASGKTSALAAVQAAIGGGSLAKLAHVGAEDPPEVVLVLDAVSGPESYIVEKEGSDTVRVRQRVGDSAAFEDVARPQAWLKSLFDPTACNPITFVRAKDDERALMLLEALPLSLDRARLAEILGEVAAELPPIPAGLHALEELALIRDAVFRKRTGVNRDQKAMAGAADQTRRATLASIPEDPVAELAAAQASVERLAAEEAAAKEKAEADSRAALAAAEAERKAEEADVRAGHEAEIASLVALFDGANAKDDAALEEKIRELRAQAQAVKDKRKADHDRRVALLVEAKDGALEVARAAERAAVGEAALAREEALSRAAAVTAELTRERERLVALQERSKAAHKAQALHQQARDFDRQAEELLAEGASLTERIDALDAYRRSLAENLPIKGLEVKEKNITVDGVPYSQLNTARQIEIAVEVSCLRAKGRRLPVLFVDGAEALDTPHFKLFTEALRKHDVQAFIGRVTDADFEAEVVAE